MAAEEMTVRVRLDTRQAKADLRAIGKEGVQASNRVGGGGRQVSGGLGRGFASGLGIGAGLNFAKRFLGGIVGDPIAFAAREASSGIRAKAEAAAGAPDARARMAAREFTRGAFLVSPGDESGMARAVSTFDVMHKINLQKEISDNLITQTTGGYTVQEVKTAARAMMDSFTQSLQEMKEALMGPSK